jgi:hypothetical protein
VNEKLSAFAGKQLAIVRYTAGHSVVDDWVYNAADIDGARVVWAREMNGTANLQLLKYYSDRQAWLVEPDRDPPGISPYPVPR